MHARSLVRVCLKLAAFAAFGVACAAGGAALSTHFGTSSYSLSYVDFISLLLTCLGVMLAVVTLFVGLLAVLGWTSLETKLRDHSFSYIGAELQEGKPLREMIRRTVIEAVYEGVSPTDNDDDTAYNDEPEASGAA